MNIEDFKQMITYTKNWKAWIERTNVNTEDEIGKKKLIEQMNVAIEKWEKELAIITDK
jgi:hypothetical protein